MIPRQDGKSSRRIWWLTGLLLAGLLVVAAVSNTSGPAGAPSTTASQQQIQAQQSQQSDLSNNNYYRNSDGDPVHSPAYSDSVPAGATAQCRDGSYSFSEHRQGTCSHHGGVDQWLN